MPEFFRQLIDWTLGWSGIPRRLQEEIRDLKASPRERLAQRPVVIHRLPWWVLATYGTTVAALLYWIVLKKSSGGPVTAAVVAGAGLSIFAGYFWSLPHELRMERDGILIRRRMLEIVCPWELFAVPGHPFRAGWTIVLPVNPAVVDLVGLFREGELQDSGVSVKTDFFAFDDVDQVRMRLGLELGPQWLGELLRTVALAMEHEESADVADAPTLAGQYVCSPLVAGADRKSQPVSPSIPAAQIDALGRLQIPCTRIMFPPECCICGATTNNRRIVGAEGRWMIFRSRTHVDVELPCCRTCSRGESIRRCAAAVVAVILNLLLWTLACLGVFGLDWLNEPGLLLGSSAFASIFTLIPAFRIAEWLSDRIGAIYFPGQHELRFAFAQEGYAGRVVQYHESIARSLPEANAKECAAES